MFDVHQSRFRTAGPVDRRHAQPCIPGQAGPLQSRPDDDMHVRRRLPLRLIRSFVNSRHGSVIRCCLCLQIAPLLAWSVPSVQAFPSHRRVSSLALMISGAVPLPARVAGHFTGLALSDVTSPVAPFPYRDVSTPGEAPPFDWLVSMAKCFPSEARRLFALTRALHPRHAKVLRPPVPQGHNTVGAGVLASRRPSQTVSVADLRGASSSSYNSSHLPGSTKTRFSFPLVTHLPPIPFFSFV